MEDLKNKNAQELENILNSKLVERAKLNDFIVEVCRVIENRGFTLEPEEREFSGKYFSVVERNKNGNE